MCLYSYMRTLYTSIYISIIIVTYALAMVTVANNSNNSQTLLDILVVTVDGYYLIRIIITL